MEKTDKELAVELASAYISTWFSREDVKKPMDGFMLKDLIENAYKIIHGLKAEE